MKTVQLLQNRQVQRGKPISKSRVRVQARKNGGEVKSRLELKLIEQLERAGAAYEYETIKLPYIKRHNYIPDFILKEQCIVIEAKGLFDLEDRSKMAAVKKAYPDLDIRILFQNENTKIRKGSTTTYKDWCVKNGFMCASGFIPDEWLKHKPTEKQREAFIRSVI